MFQGKNSRDFRAFTTSGTGLSGSGVLSLLAATAPEGRAFTRIDVGPRHHTSSFSVSVSNGSTPRLSKYPLVTRSAVTLISCEYDLWLAAAITVRKGRVPAGCAIRCATTSATSCGSGESHFYSPQKMEPEKPPLLEHRVPGARYFLRIGSRLDDHGINANSARVRNFAAACAFFPPGSRIPTKTCGKLTEGWTDFARKDGILT